MCEDIEWKFNKSQQLQSTFFKMVCAYWECLVGMGVVLSSNVEGNNNWCVFYLNKNVFTHGINYFFIVNLLSHWNKPFLTNYLKLPRRLWIGLYPQHINFWKMLFSMWVFSFGPLWVSLLSNYVKFLLCLFIQVARNSQTLLYRGWWNGGC